MTTLTEIHRNGGARMGERNGRAIPFAYDDADISYSALRKTVALADYSHGSRVMIEGSQAFDFVDYIVSGDVGAMRDQQAIFTLLLDDEGLVTSDCYVLNDEERYLVLCEHLGEAELLQWFETKKGEFDVTFRSLGESHGCLLVEGPYSWEVMSEIYGLDVTGMPFMEFMKLDGADTYLFRCGKHGEFAYEVIHTTEESARLWQRVEELAAKYDVAKVGLELQRMARLENPCWHPAVLAPISRDPIELQLQWMIRYDKERFVGRDKLLERKQRGVGGRLVGFVTDAGDDLAPGNGVFYRGTKIGTVVDFAHSKSRRMNVGLAMIERRYAYANLSDYHVLAQSGRATPITTCLIPFFVNRSLIISPAVHSYVNPGKYKNAEDQWIAEAALKSGSDRAVA
jgi:glycine cleavage system aminomethyltransferase T